VGLQLTGDAVRQQTAFGIVDGRAGIVAGSFDAQYFQYSMPGQISIVLRTAKNIESRVFQGTGRVAP